MLTALIIDDHHVVVEGISSLLREDPSITHILWADTAEKALNQLKKEHIDFILLDINLPDQSGLELCSKIKAHYPKIPIIALSTFSQPGIILKMLQNGAEAYVLKNASAEELHEAIQAVFSNEIYLSSEAKEIVKKYEAAPSIKTPIFTRREKEVLKLIAEGLTNQEIAEKLFISQLTVISHRKSLVEKTGAKNTAQLVKFCFENGYL